MAIFLTISLGKKWYQLLCGEKNIALKKQADTMKMASPRASITYNDQLFFKVVNIVQRENKWKESTVVQLTKRNIKQYCFLFGA